MQPEGKKIITCHIGNGGSISAIKDGKCVDTSMGLTPLEGLMMGTRSGDIDAGAVTFIMEKEHLDANGVSNLLNKRVVYWAFRVYPAICANWKRLLLPVIRKLFWRKRCISIV